MINSEYHETQYSGIQIIYQMIMKEINHKGST